MTAHDGHHHHDLLATARCAAEQNGEQWTPMRETVLATLRTLPQPITAYDLADAVSARLARRIAPNTVYRILDLLVEWGVVRRVESRNAYAICSHPEHQHDCIFLICKRCGKADEVEDEAVSTELQRIARSRAFVTHRPMIELSGLCQACAADADTHAA